ncbi:hypothetical protein [Chitinophaga rhizophila]|uniref:Uncharacterized protein n=1 Tax=Chitinophaga rhizophila TaxID=2866212 RepID=A0ABS7G6H5_9BACT|nr:hypothetical protein [Chitinophaga rhizophila]MBW8682981.1 hypothetical protein [Chitinophaga rhizophila]
MRLAVFFMYLCFLLSGGNETNRAGTYQHSADYTLLTATAVQPDSHFTAGDRNDAFFRDTRPVTEDEFIISEEVEDEDPNSYFSPKVKLLSRSRNAYDYQSSLKYLRRYFKAPPSFSDQASYKYLTQRALRI